MNMRFNKEDTTIALIWVILSFIALICNVFLIIDSIMNDTSYVMLWIISFYIVFVMCLVNVDNYIKYREV